MPLSKQQKIAYQKSFDKAIKTATTIDDDAAKDAIRILKRYRLRVVDEIATTEWQAHWLPQMQSGIEGAISELRTMLVSQSDQLLSNAWERGLNIVDQSFVGIQSVPSIGIGTQELIIAKDMSAGLITEITGEAQTKIMRQIQLGLMAEKSQQQVLNELGKIIISGTARGKRPASVFKTLASRTEAIYRTETLRMLNAGHRVKAEALVAEEPDLRKFWIATFDDRARPHHTSMDKKTNPARGGMPIKIKEYFVFHTAKGSITKGKHPHDPALDPSESVNCRCRLGTTLLDDEELEEFYKRD